jgi:malate permease and related proteins
LTKVLIVAAIIAAATAAGVLAEPRLQDGGKGVARIITRALLWGLLPVLSFCAMARLHLTAGAGVGLLFGYVEVAAAGALAYLVATRLLRLPGPATGAVVVCVIVVNTGYVGLPLNAALLGGDQLSFAIAFDSAVSAPFFLLIAMPVAAALGTVHTRAGHPLRALFVNPPLWAVAAGLLAPDAITPPALTDIAHVLVYVLIPFGFFVVGLSLGSESEEGALTFPPALSVPVVTAVGLRMLLAPAIMVVLALLVHSVPDAYLLQAAMPCGANSVLIAHLYGLDLKITSSAVVWSTMLALVAAVVAAPFL